MSYTRKFLCTAYVARDLLRAGEKWLIDMLLIMVIYIHGPLYPYHYSYQCLNLISLGYVKLFSHDILSAPDFFMGKVCPMHIVSPNIIFFVHLYKCGLLPVFESYVHVHLCSL